MSRIPLSTDLKTRTGAPDKDARLKNCYVEVRGESSAVRRRPSAQGGVAVGSGTAQGGIGFNIGGTDYFIGVWGDTITPYTGGGTTWDSGASYSIGDHVSVGFVDYWALTDNTNSQPPSADWNEGYVPPIPAIGYATLDATTPYLTISGNNVSDPSDNSSSVISSIGKSSGKWYWEVTGYSTGIIVGVCNNTVDLSTQIGYSPVGWSFNSLSGASSTQHNSVTGRPAVSVFMTSVGTTVTVDSSPDVHGLTTGDKATIYNSAIPDYDGTYTASVTSTTEFTYTFAGSASPTSGGFVGYGNPHTAGWVLGILLDMDIGTVAFTQNGVSLGTAYTGLTGTMYAAISTVVDNPAVVATANFGASAFAYSVPSGYNSGLYT